MSAEALIRQATEAGVEIHWVDGKIKLVGKVTAVNKILEPLREHKEDLIRWFTNPIGPEPSTDRAQWREMALAYHLHHFKCGTCIAAGQGNGLRCGTGAALWGTYQGNKEARP
jgi:hypothetical protein